MFTIKLSTRFDVVIPLVHGTNGEDGTIQGLFELKNIPFAGSNLVSSGICMDKYLTKQLLKQNSIDVLPSIYIQRKDWFEDEKKIIGKIESEFEYPVIIKPNSLGSSIGVKGAANREELAKAADNAFKLDLSILVEPLVKDLMEINCAVLDGEEKTISMTEQPLSSGGFLDFETKYLKGDKGIKNLDPAEISPESRGMEDTPRIIPAPCNEKILKKVEEYSKKACEVIGCSGVVRIDFIYDTKNDKLYLNELNTIPGSLAYYLFKDMGIDFTELTTRLIENAFRVHAIRSQRLYDYKSGLF